MGKHRRRAASIKQRTSFLTSALLWTTSKQTQRTTTYRTGAGRPGEQHPFPHTQPPSPCLPRSLPSPRPLSAVHSHIHTLATTNEAHNDDRSSVAREHTCVIAVGAVVLHHHAPQPATALTTSPHPTAIESPGVPRCVRGRQVVYWRQDRRRGGKVL